MGKFGAVALAVVFLSSSAPAAIQPFPAEFKTETIATNGARIYVRIGGAGPAVVLLHGYGETGDMWAPLAARLSRDHTVIVPDLRGLGLSSRPARGYDKKTQGEDVAGLLDALKVDKVDLVTHDIGNLVGYAFAAEHPERVPDIAVSARVPGDGCYWEVLIEDDGSGEVRLSLHTDPLDLPRAQVPEFFAAMAEMRPRTLEDVRAILVLLGAADITLRERC